MKLALVGNAANTMFSLARYLRARGFDAHLYLMANEFDQFHPSNDSYADDYRDYTSRISWSNLPSIFYSSKKSDIRQFVAKYDRVIGSGAVPAYLNKAGGCLDVFIPYGSDLYFIPFVKLLQTPKSKFHKYAFLKYHQREGIRNSRVIVMDKSNDEFESNLTKLKPRGKRIVSNSPFIYAPEYDPGNISQNYSGSKWYPEFKRIREEFEVVVFHHCRHSWKTHGNSYSYKGNEKVLSGFADFVKEHKRACLVTTEYGPDVDESKKLIQDLGIEDHVRWFPLLPRKELMIGISHCDIGIGELGMSWFSYSVIYEFLTMGKPVVHHRNDELYEGRYPQMYPMIKATSSDEITRILWNLVNDSRRFAEIGDGGREWFLKYAVEEPVNTVVEALNE
ncbi:MAG: glycosyltransferase [Bacteroidetes bacterium]|nr:glycosyltransferase [Bacteroidota bacterium]MCW5897444.1 glycosyltransferase [Bacteroidota bacterium]